MNCPKCGETLKRVEQPSEGPYSMLNADQWRSTIPGDLFCTCHNNNRGDKPYAYFWKHEVGHKGSATAQTPTQKALSQACEEAANQIGTAIKVGGYIDIAAVADLIYKYMRDLLHGEAAPPATGTQPSYEWQCMNCSFVTRDEQRAADHQTTMTPLHAYRRITLGATETQPEEWSPAVKKAMKTFNDARRKAAEEDGADCSAGRLGATGTQPSYEWQCMNCSLGPLRAALTPDSTPTQKEKK